MNNRPASHGFIAALVCLLALLGGCAGSHLQHGSTRLAEHFRHQELIGKRFEIMLPIKVYRLRQGRALALHGVPLAIVVGEKRKAGALIDYEPEPIATLPAGTVLEMVGEMVWHPSSAAVNAPPAQNFDFFIVHGQANARDLLVPFASGLTRAGIEGQVARPHLQVDFPAPFLVEVDVPSQWTRGRYEMIENAGWHEGIGLNLARRVIPPLTVR